MASASAVLAPELRTTGIGLLTTFTTLARLFASVIFGALWTTRSMETAVYVFAGGMLVALVVAAVVMARAGQLAPAASLPRIATDGLFDHDD
jgi:hypothetical protein